MEIEGAPESNFAIAERLPGSVARASALMAVICSDVREAARMEDHGPEMTDSPVASSLYKYLVPQRLKQIIGAMRIRFSQASVLNDAEELRGNYSGVAPREVIEQAVRERFQRGYPDQSALLDVLPPDEAKQLVSGAADAVEANFEGSVQKVYETLDRNFGILSLSENPASSLMWSFYGDGGRGGVLEFDPENPWFDIRKAENDSFRHLRRVSYVEDRPANYLLSPSAESVLYTKFREWSFEQEWRIIRNFNDAAELAGKDSYATDVLLFDIPPSALKAIVLGYRATPALESAIRDLVGANPSLTHIQWKRAVREVNGHIKIEPM